MIGIVLLALVALACFALGLAMLRFPDFWLEFFRSARSETGRKVNRLLMTRSTLRFQAILLIVGGGIFMVIAVLTVMR